MRYLIIFLFGFLFAIDVYIPENAVYYANFFKDSEFKVKFYKNIDKIDLNNSLAVVPFGFIPEILKNNYRILAPLEREDEYIVSNVKLDRIKTVANPTFATKIFFSSLDNNIIFKKASIRDFFRKKIDAIVLNKPIKNYYEYDLKSFGLEFNRFYLIASNGFINKKSDMIEETVENIEESPLFKPNLVYKSFIVSSVYLNKKINFDELLYENYIDNHISRKVLKVIVTPNWPPFDFIEERELKGIGVDFWRLLAKKANLDYEFILESYWPNVLKQIKEGKADITINTSETKDRKEYAVFTKPYMKFPLALVCRKNVQENDIYKLKIGVGKDFTAEKLMKKHYPKINLTEKKNTIEALKNVENGKIDCVVDSLPVLIYLVNKNNILNVKLYKKLPIDFKLQIMIRKDLVYLRDKLNDAIDKISDEEKNTIVSKYIGLIDEEIVKHKKEKILNLLILIILIIVIVILIYKYFRIHKIANYDKLTKIYNRNILSKELKKLLNHRGSVIYFDIDHFKNINDTYGHEKGDFVLKELAKIIKNNIREDDFFGRWGGEEFLIILPYTSYFEAIIVAEKLRKIIESHDFDGIKVTSSFGVTYVKKDDNEETLLERVDRALYEAKNSGRNQVKGIL
ncbi:polar amino acid transport system substrate-binding protein [Lebetimonas natsushimae]|uniref:diguanylate cyclase n=1 Tax=Lebetimonas natsushimae TaxID=1936991 RepID=A0A292YB05_9BACT|nr:diguanylate cyclase [Lebetimonas natsushimae]GAX86938.1 polar amino acid transport system substrate-binding protein [Lebetimonas natsushimae]